jgi:hypothetical protein
MTALVVAFIMTLWVVAALYRNSFITSSVLYSYHKSEAHYLAKRAVSRSLYFLNSDGSWLSRHGSRDSADRLTAGAICWAENNGSGFVLKCEAKVGPQTARLTVPLKVLDNNDTHVYSVAPSGNGPDAIAWTTEETAGWRALPPIPGSVEILEVTGAANGDVFAVASSSEAKSTLWRYRTGRGWVKMPDLPSNVKLTSLSVAESSRLVGLADNNTLQALKLVDGLQWSEVPAPRGLTMTDATVAVTDATRAYATATDGRDSSLHRFDFATSKWTTLSSPVAVHFDPGSGQIASEGGDVSDYSGGIAVASNGHVFAASNPAGEPSVIYELETGSGDWRVLPPVPAYEWDAAGDGVSAVKYAENLRDLNVDDDGVLWVQWQSPTDNSYSTLSIDPRG